eukprot:543424-Pelagomonas_calceolata.AAC.3
MLATAAAAGMCCCYGFGQGQHTRNAAVAALALEPISSNGDGKVLTAAQELRRDAPTLQQLEQAHLLHPAVLNHTAAWAVHHHATYSKPPAAQPLQCSLADPLQMRRILFCAIIGFPQVQSRRRPEFCVLADPVPRRILNARTSVCP